MRSYCQWLQYKRKIERIFEYMKVPKIQESTMTNSLYVLNWETLLSILDISPVFRSLLHMWYVSASSNSECHIGMFFIFDFTNVLALARYSSTGHRKF